MNVLSLFDGMSCGMAALDRLGIPVANYYASEVDKYAIQISRKNYPEIWQVGDINSLKEDTLPKIDLLLGGSPCQGFSVAGKQLNFDDPRSKLFFRYVDVLQALRRKNPEVLFLLENVKMKKEWQDIISSYLQVEPIEINSALFSAQNRKRLYWTNIPLLDMPEDKGLLIGDILEDGRGAIGRMVGRKINPQTGKRDDYNPNLVTKQRIEARTDGKSGTLTTVQKDNIVLQGIPVIKAHGEYDLRAEKSRCLDANYWKGPDNHGQRTVILDCEELGHARLNGHDFLKRVYSIWGKCPTLTAVCGGNQERKIAVDGQRWRKLTPLECERLQTLPDNYTEGVSNSQRYKMIGNGWTVDVICYLLSYIKLMY